MFLDIPECPRCGGEQEWIDCDACAGEGVDGHNCGEDTCACAEPEDNVDCDICEGKGGWWRCSNSFTFCSAATAGRAGGRGGMSALDTRPGRKCIDCDAEAQHDGHHRKGGWSPLWCIECDEKRIQRITASMESIAANWPKVEPAP